MSKKIVIFGTGEIAELAYYYMTNDKDYPHQVVAFTCDPEYAKSSSFMGLPLIPFDQIEGEYPAERYVMHVALSYKRLNEVRKEKYLEAKAKGYELISYVCSKSVTWPDLSIGDNCLILENQTIQPKVQIGNNVMIWSGNHLGHGCKIKDHSYLSSHICISGYTEIGERCFVGVNSAFKDYIKIGNEVFISMGANVTSSVNNGAVVLGPQSTILNESDPLAIKIKSRYFQL